MILGPGTRLVGLFAVVLFVSSLGVTTYDPGDQEMSLKHLVRIAVGIGVVAAAIATGSGDYSAAPRSTDRDERALTAFANLPPAFVENRGQADARVRYYAAGPRYVFHLTRDAAVLTFLKGPGDKADGGVVLAMHFVGANPRVSLQAEDRAPGEVNYFRGNDPAGWRTSLPRYAQVVYRDLWPGIDMAMLGQPGELKYEFRVRPGASVGDIQLAYSGADGLTLDDDGALRIKTAMGVLRDSPPVAYQTIGGSRVPVDSRYVLDAGGRGYSFAVGSGYRPEHELVIDPGLEYSTFLGGSSHDFGAAIAVDSAGNAYVAGTTQSTNFPTTTGAFDRTFNGGVVDVFVTKINPTGTALVYSTFLGGTPAQVPAGGADPFEFGRAIAVDSAGNAYVAGQTTSGNFPTTAGAFDRSLNIGTFDATDAFVTKLNAAGSGLVYSTFLGGTDIDDALAIAIDGSGNAYVGGETGSTNFPTTAGAFDRTINGSFDAFVVKFNATGSALVYSTYLGGTQVEYVAGIRVDASGNAYAAGPTRSPDFPTTAGAFDTTQNGEFDAFVTKLNPTGSALVYSTFLGGSGFDSGDSVAIDSAGNAYVAGGAGSLDFPTTPGAFDTTPDGSDAFVTKLNASGSALVYSTMVGGTGGEGAGGIALDSANNAWITGGTGSSDFPVTADGFDTSFNGSADVFVTELNPTGSALVYSTYLGGVNSESGRAIAVTPAGLAYVTGHTYSIDFPVTAGAFDITWEGNPEIFWGDGFVAKLGGSTPPAPPPTPAAPTLVSPFNGENVPQPITFNWNVATGAATFQIQIDDSSAFTAPLERDQAGLTVTRYATSGLSTGTHFWRVRGVNTAGVGGPFSAVRSFTAQEAPPPPVLGSLDVNPSTVVGGESSSGTAVLSTPAPEGGAVIALSSSNPAVASVPATTTAASNQFTASFVISTSAVAATTTVTITGSYNGSTRTANITVTPQGSPSTSLQTVAVSPGSVTGGNSAQGAVILSSAAPAGGVVVSLSSSHSAATTPPSVTVQSGATSAVFGISTTTVSTSTAVTISGVFNGVARSTTLTINPNSPPPPATLQNLTLNPTSVTGGSSSQGTVTLSGGAPQGGAIVSLSSSNTAAGTVPASVTVAGGATSATFTVGTSSVSSSTTVTISGTYNATTRTATLTVAPAGSTPLPAPSLQSPAADARFSVGATILFNWTDVAGAASYTIQIDNSQSFSAPLTVEQTVAVSQFSTNTLPRTRMWFRVRAVNASGAPGAWSSVRRFEVR